MGQLGLKRQPFRSNNNTSIIAGGGDLVTWLMAGATFNWALVAAAGADTTLPDGTFIRAGQKYLKGGQSVARAGAPGSNAKFGPYDPAANDGRQTLVPDECGLIERTIVLDGSLGLGLNDDQHIGIITGGEVWRGKLVCSGTATHSLVAGPTEAELRAGMPGLRLISK